MKVVVVERTTFGVARRSANARQSATIVENRFRCFQFRAWMMSSMSALLGETEPLQQPPPALMRRSSRVDLTLSAAQHAAQAQEQQQQPTIRRRASMVERSPTAEPQATPPPQLPRRAGVARARSSRRLVTRKDARGLRQKMETGWDEFVSGRRARGGFRRRRRRRDKAGNELAVCGRSSKAAKEKGARSSLGFRRKGRWRGSCVRAAFEFAGDSLVVRGGGVMRQTKAPVSKERSVPTVLWVVESSRSAIQGRNRGV